MKMKHIAQFNEENKWRNLALGAMLLFTSCKDDISITDRKGNPVSVDNFKGKTIKGTIEHESVVPRMETESDYSHDIIINDVDGNTIEFSEVENESGKRYRNGDSVEIKFDENGDAKTLIVKGDENPFFSNSWE